MNASCSAERLASVASRGNSMMCNKRGFDSMKPMGMTLLILSLVLFAGTVRADEKAPGNEMVKVNAMAQVSALPDAGQLRREIERQELVFNLSDRVRKLDRQEPDLPYGVSGDGILLPDNLCDRPDARGCQAVEVRRP
jgi:hypothetical protein